MMATMEDGPTKAYDQDEATGFIRLKTLRLKVAADPKIAIFELATHGGKWF